MTKESPTTELSRRGTLAGGAEGSLPLPSFSRILDPSAGEPEPWYVNDHCFIQDDDTWHLFGITHPEPAIPAGERFFLHATAPGLWGPWTRHAPVLHADPFAFERHNWAPFVVHHDGRYWMYYAAGGDANMFRMHLATSEDLFTWTRHPANPMFIDGFDGRDPMVLRVGDEWMMYYCGSRPVYGGESTVLLVTSDDLVQWSDPEVAFNAGGANTRGILCESPQVVERDGRYYLFVCNNRPYLNTQVYVSDSPRHWTAEGLVGSYAAHASEVIRTRDGKWFVSHCGYGQGGVYLSEFPWDGPAAK